uniref:Uncharacterized protein n=1 Tax=Oryza glaberrima TaxID=4538 RepID=I1QW49_ORYGL
MRKQRGSSSAVSIWKALLILLALICALRPAQGGRGVSVGYPGPRSNKASSYYRGGGGCSSIDECDGPPAPGRAGAADAIGRNGALNPPRYPVPRIPGEPYTRPGRGCTVAYGCYGGPPAAKP